MTGGMTVIKTYSHCYIFYSLYTIVTGGNMDFEGFFGYFKSFLRC